MKMCLKLNTLFYPVSYTHLDVYKRQEEYRADEDTIKNAFITAQKTADKLMNETKQKAQMRGKRTIPTASKSTRTCRFCRMAMRSLRMRMGT